LEFENEKSNIIDFRGNDMDKSQSESSVPLKSDEKKIKITKNGPYVVSGNISLSKERIITDDQEVPIKWAIGEKYPINNNYSLCRCGQSKSKPYCDGSHIKTGFDGTEIATHKSYLEQSQTTSGPELILTDAPVLCSSAQFCHRSLGAWVLTKRSDVKRFKELAIQEAQDCPSGRLVEWDKEKNNPMEPTFSPSISVIEIPTLKVSGPLWVKGKILIEGSDGQSYELRNRVTLCRCGKSTNKPFCNGAHVGFQFNDGDESLSS
jgi:CDGSH-type Zn-finger protein